MNQKETLELLGKQFQINVCMYADIHDMPFKEGISYYRLSFTKWKGMPMANILYPKKLSWMNKTLYTLNLQTGLPTQKSERQKRLPDELLDALIKLHPDTKFMRWGITNNTISLALCINWFPKYGLIPDSRLSNYMKKILDEYSKVKPVEILRLTLH